MNSQETSFFLFFYFDHQVFYKSTSMWVSQPQQTLSLSLKMNRKKQTQIQNAFIQELKQKHKNCYIKQWSKEEDAKILQFAKRNRNWSELSKELVGKSSKIIQRRYVNLIKKESAWPNKIREEIKYLREALKLSWIQIELKLKIKYAACQTYTAKQIREKYKNFIEVQPNRSKWSLQEDLKLWGKVSQIGKNWKGISSYFPKRTSLQIRNRYYKFLEPAFEKVREKFI